MVYTPSSTPVRSTATMIGTSSPTWTPLPPTATPFRPLKPTPSPTLTSTPTATITPTPTVTFTPLPAFTSKLLRQGVEAVPYIANPCEYLRQKWDPKNSSPGTVVVPVMFHSILKDGRTPSDAKDITLKQFNNFVSYAKHLGFQTITIAQLEDFLHSNALIPEHSMLLFVDDRRPGVVTDYFLPVLKENQWTLTLAWISDPNDMAWAWKQMEQANETGLLDVQAHGYDHKYIIGSTPEDEIRQEIFGPLQPIEQAFGKAPTAFIWPGGNYTELAVQIAREAGYQLGFTAYSRGPLMFNWIPLGADERAMGDPLMVLPRDWSIAANVNLDEALKISAQARQEAEAKRGEEENWYQMTCK